MCGIFGVLRDGSNRISGANLIRLAERLMILSESRGSEAAGLAIGSESGIRYFKRALRGRVMLRSEEYKTFIASAALGSGPVAIIGHSRLVTNGTQGLDENNQPIATRLSVGVHNGIVVNDSALWAAHPSLRREHEVDTEVVYQLIDHEYEVDGNLVRAVSSLYEKIEGEATIAFLHAQESYLTLATNVGSLYWARVVSSGLFVFASEAVFLRKLLSTSTEGRVWNKTVTRVPPGEGVTVPFSSAAPSFFTMSEIGVANSNNQTTNRATVRALVDCSPQATVLRRCTRCILPHTFPFIEFDREGVCIYCRAHVDSRADNLQTLEERVAPYRRKDGQPDCIVALSGGRDSCYGLHVIKNELGMHPIAYTYDWAMVTDEARRNCARLCGALGVEHIIRSADILTKRRNIRLNIESWLKRPELGMIPLFMAGDKQFFHYASEVSKQTKVPLVFFCGGNNLEVTRFKTGFCGVRDESTNTMVGLDTVGKIQLMLYYGRQFLLNPAYLNRSLFDTAFAFYSTYVGRGDFLYLYRYVEWNEQRIEETLTDKYGWESAQDTANSWRIGDGTAAFYNYIYHTVAGFTEHDTFRSNQIRAGLITRDQAMALIFDDNRPRYDAMREYAQLVGFNLDGALAIINNIPKLR